MTVTLDRLTPARPLVRVRGQVVEWPYSAVQQLRVREDVEGLATLELTLENWGTQRDGSADLLYEDERDLAFGTEIQVGFFSGDDSVPVFSGRISALEAQFGLGGPPRLTVFAEDGMASLRLARRSRVFEDMSAGDVCARVAQDHGLTLAGDTGFGQTQDWAQVGETDLAFVRRLARRHDRALRLDGRDLHVGRSVDAGAEPIALHIERDLASLRLLADLAHQCTGVRVTGFDVAAGEAFDEVATEPGPAAGRGRRGPALRQETFGEREDLLSHLSARTAREASALVQAALDARAARWVVAQGKAIGQPRLRVGADVDLQGAGPRFSNVYAVTCCEHRFTLATGYETDFEAVCAFFGKPA
jgi:phage protein D